MTNVLRIIASRLFSLFCATLLIYAMLSGAAYY